MDFFNRLLERRAKGLTIRWLFIGIVISCLSVGLVAASPVRAQNRTSSANIRAAVNFAASQGGICNSRPQDEALCRGTVMACNNDKWKSFIGDHVDFCGPTVCKADKKSDVIVPQEVVDYLNKDVNNRNQIPPIQFSDCYCLCAENDTDGPCKGIPAETPVYKDSNTTLEECEAICAPRKVAPKCAGKLPRVERTDSQTPTTQAAVAAASKSEALQMTCFSQAECAKQDGTYEAFGECRGGKGRCISNAPPVKLNVPIGNVKEIRGFQEYVVTIYRYLLSVLVVVVTVMFIYGAFRYLVGSSIGGVQRGRDAMMDAVIGMFLVLGATTILRTINPALTNLNPLKVYMVNTVQYISAVYCTDLPRGTKLAQAGDPSHLIDREQVDKMKGAYSIAPDDAACGQSYYVEGSSGGACEGMTCSKKGKACISCAGGVLPECNGVASSKKICAQMELGGNINYADGRYPTAVKLVLACGFAKNPTDLGTITSNLKLPKHNANLNRGPNAGTNDASASGIAAYSVNISDEELSQYSTECGSPTGNRLLGGFLAVEYKGGTAVIAKSKCVGGGGRLSGFANDSVSKAFQCAINPPNTDFEDPGSAYWTLDQLRKAASGESPIVCNFNLDNTAAPENPASKVGYCAAAAGGPNPAQQPDPCPHGGNCSGTGQTCQSTTGKSCTCRQSTKTIMGTSGDPIVIQALTWECQ